MDEHRTRGSQFFVEAAQSNETSEQSTQAVTGLTFQRVALLIANSDYEPVGLQNPENDIRKVGDALEARGFEIITRVNVGYQELKQAISDFESVLKLGGVGVIYYAGHAIHRAGHDILLPVDIAQQLSGQLSAESRGVKALGGRAKEPVAKPFVPPVVKDRILGAVYLSELLAPIDVIVDKRRGDSGSVVIYSASRGELALDASVEDENHSPFAKAFAEAVEAGNRELFGIFRKISKLVPAYSGYQQTPTVEASVSKAFYFDRPWRDGDIGVLKIVVIDSCRTDLDVEGLYARPMKR